MKKLCNIATEIYRSINEHIVMTQVPLLFQSQLNFNCGQRIDL